jgi:hypothetical protein
MANVPLTTIPNSVGSTPENPVPPRPRRYCCCDPGYQRQRPWTAERIAHLCSNVIIFVGISIALVFAIVAANQAPTGDITLTVFIVGGTLFGGACLLALVNVAWMSRRPGVHVSTIQLICNVVLFLITSYLELLFWPYPNIAFSILFGAGLPMFIMVNLPSCFVKKTRDQLMDGDTVCLEEDVIDDDATIVDDLEAPSDIMKKQDHADVDVDDAQRMSITMEDSSMSEDEEDKLESKEASAELCLQAEA